MLKDYVKEIEQDSKKPLKHRMVVAMSVEFVDFCLWSFSCTSASLSIFDNTFSFLVLNYHHSFH